MNISVVIPTANRHNIICQAIDKIFDNTVQPYEVIVVDQSKNDLTLCSLSKFIQNDKVRYIRDDGSGAARARNIGWRAASGEIIAFTDDDALVDLKWLENIQFTFKLENFNIGVLGGKIISFYEHKNPDWHIPQKWEYLLPKYDQGNLLERYSVSSFPPSVNYAIYRSLLEEFSGFNETLGPNVGRKLQLYGEDGDLALRLKNSNYDIIYNPDCVVYHPVPLSRQNQDFLNHRLLSEGATYAYLQIKQGKKFSSTLISLTTSFVKYCYLNLIKPNNEEIYYLRGKILVMFKCGILSSSIDSL